MDDFFGRATLVKLRMDKVTSDARRAADDGDFERLRACRCEMEVLYASMLAIREEQVIAYMPKPGVTPWRKVRTWFTSRRVG